MSQLQTVYLMNVVLYFTIKKTILQFVQINKKCYDAVKGLHRAPNVGMLSLSTQLRIFPKLQHVSGDLLLFQNLVSLKQLQRISSFENENKSALTPIESIHKAFIGRVKQINITYPISDLNKFKKIEEIRITFNREYLSKKEKKNKTFIIDADDINKKICYLKMLKRIILYDISESMLKMNINVFKEFNPSIQLFICYDDPIEDSLLNALPNNAYIIAKVFTSLHPKIVCLLNNMVFTINAYWDSAFDSKVFQFIQKMYYPKIVSIEFSNVDKGIKNCVDLSHFLNYQMEKLIIKSDMKQFISQSPNSSVTRLEILSRCTSIDIQNSNIKHLIISEASRIEINSALEILEILQSTRYGTSITYNGSKESLLIKTSNISLGIKGINKLKIIGQRSIFFHYIRTHTLQVDNALLQFSGIISSDNFKITKLKLNNVKQNSNLDLSMLPCINTLCFSNCKLLKIQLPTNLQNIIWDKTDGEILNIENLNKSIQAQLNSQSY
ncbi:hypothetical protein QTN25_009750 [Entamoeba marina]